jgi:hypothetical protein
VKWTAVVVLLSENSYPVFLGCWRAVRTRLIVVLTRVFSQVDRACCVDEPIVLALVLLNVFGMAQKQCNF